jgi:hypothetical protein
MLKSKKNAKVRLESKNNITHVLNQLDGRMPKGSSKPVRKWEHELRELAKNYKL